MNQWLSLLTEDFNFRELTAVLHEEMTHCQSTWSDPQITHTKPVFLLLNVQCHLYYLNINTLPIVSYFVFCIIKQINLKVHFCAKTVHKTKLAAQQGPSLQLLLVIIIHSERWRLELIQEHLERKAEKHSGQVTKPSEGFSVIRHCCFQALKMCQWSI